MDANQDSIGTCPDYGLEAYAGWCEEEAACRLQLATLRDSLGGFYTDEDTYLITGEAACWLTAANLARGCYTGEGVFA